MKRLISVFALSVLLFAIASDSYGQTTGAPFPHLPFDFRSAAGIAASGAVLCSFAAGTTTPLSIYSDSGLTTAIHNPTYLDAIGRITNGTTAAATAVNAYTLPRDYKYILYAAGATGSACPLTGTTVQSWDHIYNPAFLPSFDGVQLCSRQQGSTDSAKISAAIAALPSTGGLIDCSGLQGARTISGSDPFAGVTKPVTMLCAGATYTVSVAVTVPQNVSLSTQEGCLFTGASTLTINGKIDNPQNQQIFSTTLPLNLAGGNQPYPEWFGGKPDGATDNKAAIQAAISSFSGNSNPYGGTVGPAGGGWSTVRFNPGVYLMLTGVTVAHSGIHLKGAGNSATILRFQPVSTATMFTWNAGEELHDSDVSDLTLDATGSSVGVVKTAMYLYDVAEFSMTNLTVRDFHDTTHASQCLELHGREQITQENVYLFCNRPLYIGADPETSTEGLDRSMFHNVLFAAIESIASGGACVTDKPVIEITEADAFLADVTFDGYDFICGSYSVYWSNTNAKQGSYNVAFLNGRNEQSGPLWGFYIAPPTNNPVTNLRFDNTHVYSGTLGGWYLRNVANGSINSSAYNPASAVAPINADATVSMSFTNMNWNVHTAGNYNALNGWCGVRYNEDSAGSNTGTGQLYLGSCGNNQIMMGNPPEQTRPAVLTSAYSITDATVSLCAGYLSTYKIGAHSLGVGGQIYVAGVVSTGTPTTGLNGTFTIVAVTGTTVTVVNPLCPQTYSSGGANALTYGAPTYIGNNLLSGQITGDLGLRSDGSAIRFGHSGATSVVMPSTGGIVLTTATSTVAAAQIGIGNSVVAAGAANCPATVTTDAGAEVPAGCWAVSIAGTTRYIPFF